MSGPKRNPDKLNTIGIVVVGICGAVLVYVTIIALQAFYMNDTSEVQNEADYGGQDKTAIGHKADEMRNITEVAKNSAGDTFRIKIQDAMNDIVRDAKERPDHLVPALPAATKPTIQPVYGRPKTLEAPAAPAPAEGSAAAPAAGSAAAPAAGSAAAPAAGSAAAPAAGSAAPGGGNAH
jgi:hypothetical protein